MLWMFERAAKKNSYLKNRQFCFASSHLQARVAAKQSCDRNIECNCNGQKINYIYNNLLESGFVTIPVDWKYSSAQNYGDNDWTILEIDLNVQI